MSLVFVNNDCEGFGDLVQAEGSYNNEINFLNSHGDALDEITFVWKLKDMLWLQIGYQSV